MTTTGPAATSRAAVTARAPRPLTVASLLLAVVGLAASAYLTYEHLDATATLACPNTGRIDCAKVTSSRYSELAGIPVAVLGLAFFVVVVALVLPRAWRSTRPEVRLARGVVVTGGLLFVLYLVWAELYEVGSICLWCTGVHVVTLLLFVTVLFAEALREE